MPTWLDQMAAEIRTLERSLEADPRFIKLRELQAAYGRILPLYESDLQSAGAATLESPSMQDVEGRPRQKGTRQMAPTTRVVVDAVGVFLSGKIVPVPLREIYEHLAENGCQIGGQEPVNTLSAILSRYGFKSHGRSGWTLQEPAQALASEPDDGLDPVVAQEKLLAPRPNGRVPLFS